MILVDYDNNNIILDAVNLMQSITNRDQYFDVEDALLLAVCPPT